MGPLLGDISAPTPAAGGDSSCRRVETPATAARGGRTVSRPEIHHQNVNWFTLGLHARLSELDKASPAVNSASFALLGIQGVTGQL